MEKYCREGKHNLGVIYRHSGDGMSTDVVRWCKDCGAVVIDCDYDNRTNPGQIMKMRFPKLMLDSFE